MQKQNGEADAARDLLNSKLATENAELKVEILALKSRVANNEKRKLSEELESAAPVKVARIESMATSVSGATTLKTAAKQEPLPPQGDDPLRGEECPACRKKFNRPLDMLTHLTSKKDAPHTSYCLQHGSNIDAAKCSPMCRVAQPKRQVNNNSNNNNDNNDNDNKQQKQQKQQKTLEEIKAAREAKKMKWEEEKAEREAAAAAYRKEREELRREKEEKKKETLLMKQKEWLAKAPEREAAAATDPLAGKYKCFAWLHPEPEDGEFERFPEEKQPFFYVTQDSLSIRGENFMDAELGLEPKQLMEYRPNGEETGLGFRCGRCGRDQSAGTGIGKRGILFCLVS